MTLELLAASTMGPPNGLRTDLLCRRPMWRDAICFFFLFIHPNRTIFYSGVQYSPKDMRTFASMGTHIPVQSIHPA